MHNLHASPGTSQSADTRSARSPRTSSVALATTLPPRVIERYVGLDIGNTIELCEVVDEKVTRRATIKTEKRLEELLGAHTRTARVVFEACRQGWYLYDLLTAWGHEVWMVDTTRAKQMGIGQHKRKNDRIDAETLARAAESGKVPRAHMLSHDSQQLRMQLQVRQALVETRAQYVVTIRGILRSQGLAVRSCGVASFLKRLAEKDLPPSIHKLVEPLVVSLQTIGSQIDTMDKELDEHLASLPIVRVLSSAPGVGRIVAAAFISVIDNPGRFRSAHKVEAYLGLVPSEKTSGKRKLGAITKQGNGYLRSMLTQAAWSILRLRRSDPLKRWGLAIAKRRGKRIAAVAVARRLAGILWAMWRDTTTYDSELLGTRSARGKHNEAADTKRTAQAIEAEAARRSA